MAPPDSNQASNGSADDAAFDVPEFRPRKNEVRIRMYGQGLGDCFLLAFPRTQPTTAVPAVDDQRPVYVLIDCGVITGTPNASQRMKRIVKDIRLTTRDDTLPPTAKGPQGHLDLLILTHEHWDHLSGFIDAQDEWEQIQVDKLWTSWTEQDDPNGLAGVLQKIKNQQRRALVEVVKRAAHMTADDSLRTAVDIASFLSEAQFDGQSFAAGRSLADGLAFAKDRVAKGNHVCCEPGEVHAVPGTDTGAYVLGPPQDWERLTTMNPSAQDPETYEGGQAQHLTGIDSLLRLRRMVDQPSAFNAVVMPLIGPALAATDETGADEATLLERDLFDRSFPFDRSVRVPIPAAESAAANAAAAYPALDSYFADINQWRRIDFDWLSTAGSFALAVDNFINNTSLVLAFELPAASAGGEQKVLLFVADAQVGNWLSWDEIKKDWKLRDGVQASQQKPDMVDLFQRVAFYKVGHHGSHNATLKEKGIERMGNDGDLTAFVPVSINVARDIKGWCEMPLDEMLGALSDRTNGRVVLPNGKIWDRHDQRDRDPSADERKRIGLEVSDDRLPAKRKDGIPNPIEDKVPLWVQVAIDY